MTAAQSIVMGLGGLVFLPFGTVAIWLAVGGLLLPEQHPRVLAHAGPLVARVSYCGLLAFGLGLVCMAVLFLILACRPTLEHSRLTELLLLLGGGLFILGSIIWTTANIIYPADWGIGP